MAKKTERFDMLLTNDMFDLIADEEPSACSQCCNTSSGGNKS